MRHLIFPTVAQDAEPSADWLASVEEAKLGDWVVCASLTGGLIGDDVTGELLLSVKVLTAG